LSRFIRELRKSEAGFGLGNAYSREEPEFIIDLNNVETDRSGLHASGKYFEKYGLVPPPRGAPDKWYEGNEIFVRVSSPAQPTKATRQNYYDAYGKQLPAAKLSSAVPRLKTGLWISRGVLRFAQG
jgi:hypothetical protein